MKVCRLVLGLLAALLALASAWGLAQASEEPPMVAASIFPLGDVLAQIGGPFFDVMVLLPPGASPHGFEVRPSQIEELSGARLLVVVGSGMDAWAKKAARSLQSDSLSVLSFVQVVAAQNRALLRHTLDDPHIWLDPVLMDALIEVLADSLSALRPDVADSIAARAMALRGQLKDLDRWFRERIAGARRKAFVSLHAAFAHLAARYGLSYKAAYKAHMEEPGPREMEDVLSFMRKNDIRVVFTQPQIPASKLKWITDYAKARIEVLDPIGGPGRDGFDSYLAMMRSNLEAIARSLEEE